MMFEYWNFAFNGLYAFAYVRGGLMARKQEYTKEEVSKALKETGWLKIKEIDQHPDLPSYMTVLNIFNTTKITDVWKELNIPSQKPSYTKEEVVKALKEIGWLKQSDIEKHPNLPSRNTILKLFKTTSMANVWNELGIPVPYTKDSASKALKALKQIGWLTQEAIDQHPDLPSVPTILRLFKTTKINDVWKELDIFEI